MKIVLKQPKVIFSMVSALGFLFLLGLDSDVFARASGGRSSGSRGYSSGGSYQRSPSQSPTPVQRDYQQPSQQSQPPPAGAGRSFFSGLAGGLAGGLLGGMLFRSLGFADGPGWGGGFGFGDIFLLLVILGIIYFVIKRFRSREIMQMSTAGAGSAPNSYPGTSLLPTYVPASPDEFMKEPKTEGLRHIKEMDASFNESSFKDLVEDIFFKIQGGWTKRDLGGVRHLLNPEMFNILHQDVNRLLSGKKINRLENIAVREVEIVEAGQNRGEEFITVKFYANLLDYVVNETDGQIFSGSSNDPVKFLEYWTFSRNVGEKNWVLAGINQEGDL